MPYDRGLRPRGLLPGQRVCEAGRLRRQRITALSHGAYERRRNPPGPPQSAGGAIPASNMHTANDWASSRSEHPLHTERENAGPD
jgi:hypothetical protein